jgi:hypothetical protein
MLGRLLMRVFRGERYRLRANDRAQQQDGEYSPGRRRLSSHLVDHYRTLSSALAEIDSIENQQENDLRNGGYQGYYIVGHLGVSVTTNKEKN